MKQLLAIAAILLATALPAQHIVISGGVYDADTMYITISHNGKVVDQKTNVGKVYTLTLGGKDFYEIKFESNERIKYFHFFCYNLKSPTTITEDIHFSNQTNLILWLWRHEGQKKKTPERTLWGAHASWKDEF